MATSSDVLRFLIPQGGYVMVGDEYEGIQFINCTPITKDQFLAGFAPTELAKLAAAQAITDARASGIAHALSLGFTQAHAEAMFP